MAENGTTKCGALVKTLAALIESGEYRPHQKFFSVTRLMRSDQVSQGTVTEALKRLERSGLSYARPGSGTFVPPPQKVSHDGAISDCRRQLYLEWMAAAIRQRTPVPGGQNRFAAIEKESVIPLAIKPTAKGTLP